MLSNDGLIMHLMYYQCRGVEIFIITFFTSALIRVSGLLFSMDNHKIIEIMYSFNSSLF